MPPLPKTRTSSTTTARFIPDERCQWGRQRRQQRRCRQQIFQEFRAQYKHVFPELESIHDFIEIGDYEQSDKLMTSIYQQWSQGQKGQLSASKNRLYRSMQPGFTSWRAVFLHAQNHYNVFRTTYGIHKKIEEPALRANAAIMNFPIPLPTVVWTHGQRWDVDPYLMLGLLRQESTYRETIRSSVGAIGYVQVMPATGAKVAYLLEEKNYSPLILENPADNLRYGIFYFSKLMERFDSSYPLAVGAYNGGPHNISRWFQPVKDRCDMAEFVEHIPYDETRRYIKKVTGYYKAYVEVYHPDEEILIPNLPADDDRSVIDF